MLNFGLAVLFAVAILGCGGGTRSDGSSGGVSTYPLPGGSQIRIAAGDCIIVNADPQSLPPATVSYSLTDAGGSYPDTYEVGVVPSSDTCQFSQADSFVDDGFTGSAGDSAAVPTGTYDLDVICQNGSVDCLIDRITWSATY